MALILSGNDVAHVNRICRYLALDDFTPRPPQPGDIEQRSGAAPFDVIAVFGNQVLETVSGACALFKQGLARRLLFSGGRGHSTHLLFGNLQSSPRFGDLVGTGAVTPQMAEADMMAAIATAAFGIPAPSLLVENRSTNTGENARFSWALMGGLLPQTRSILLLQDPVMQRRSVLTLAHVLQQVAQPPALSSHSVFVPQRSVGGFRTPAPPAVPPWDEERFLPLVLGEVERLRNDANGYGPNGRGFIPAEEVPADVLESYAILKTRVAAR